VDDQSAATADGPPPRASANARAAPTHAASAHASRATPKHSPLKCTYCLCGFVIGIFAFAAAQTAGANPTE